MMEGPIVGAGKGGKRTGMAFAPGPRVRASTVALGTMALKWWGSTRGPAATPMKATGLKARGMAWELRRKDGGFTKVNGPMASREGTG